MFFFGKNRAECRFQETKRLDGTGNLHPMPERFSASSTLRPLPCTGVGMAEMEVSHGLVAQVSQMFQLSRGCKRKGRRPPDRHICGLNRDLFGVLSVTVPTNSDGCSLCKKIAFFLQILLAFSAKWHIMYSKEKFERWDRRRKERKTTGSRRRKSSVTSWRI